tara:strand:+ start:334 stop:603 length:270 start_codon:yes stop_codon:yes gene_type:complete
MNVKIGNMTKEQKIPKWFNGTVYEEGGTVANRFTGEEYELNNIELSIYDFIIGATIISEMGLDTDITNLRKGLDWFRQYNAKAYMVLLD